MNFHLAQVNIAIAKYSRDDSRFAGFVDNLDRIYALSESTPGFVWRPSIHMPRWASRIDLEVTGVRVERLQEINGNDAVAEGCIPQPSDCRLCMNGICSAHQPPTGQFAHLWDSLNAKRAPWESNPWVWVIEFEYHRGGE